MVAAAVPLQNRVLRNSRAVSRVTAGPEQLRGVANCVWMPRGKDMSKTMRVGFVGWRGMVGSVLMQRMREENDFALITPVFYSTSNAGGAAPDVGQG